ncbi:MAG: glycosyltransferase family 9 protein [Chloroflexi bacterium]|nr:glycosyltransferase family 9 protein [Chloroflexota bacterium]
MASASSMRRGHVHGMLPDVERLLVFRAGALGDALLTLHPLAALRTRFPDAHITVIAPRALAQCIRLETICDAHLPIEGDAGLVVFQENGPAPAWAVCDLAVVWMAQWRHVAQRVQSWGTARVLGGPSLPDEGSGVHVTDHLFELLAPLGIGQSRLIGPAPAPDLSPNSEQMIDQIFQRTWQPVVALHPGSGGPGKRWPRALVEDLLRQLSSAGASTLIVLGPVEEAERETWSAFAGVTRGCTLAPQLGLPALTHLLQQCTVFVGNDSGVTHLAAVLGVPTVALFGPTRPGRWRPLGPRVMIIDAGSRWPPSVPTVRLAILQLLR